MFCDLPELLSRVEKEYKLLNKLWLQKKYRIDGKILFVRSKEELLQFFTIANNGHHLLKITFENARESTTFVDLDIYMHTAIPM